MKKLIFCKFFLAPALAGALLLGGCYMGDVSEGLGNYMDFGMGIQPQADQFAEYVENPFISALETPLSTFSVDADGASYAFMRGCVGGRFFTPRMPYPQSVRLEEYLNYFTFDYPEPTGEESLALSAELSACPWAPEHRLLRLGIKGKSLTEAQLPDQNFVLLIDQSGSMQGEDRLDLLKKGFTALVDQMRPRDRMAIVTYAAQAGVLLPPTYGDRKKEIKKAISKLEAGGTTAGYDGIGTAYKLAEESFVPGGNNRIILGSDGDFNVGPYDVESLVELVKSQRDKGIYLTVLGVGMGNLNDHMMEQMANNGNGNYEYLDCQEQLEKVFVHERSKFTAVAKDAKIQIAFDPQVVDKYRLLGYENRMLTEEEFEDESTDAGEIGSGQTITALYEIIPTEAGLAGGNPGTFTLRYKRTDVGDSRELSIALGSAASAPDIADASQNQRFAASLAAAALVLRQSEYKGQATLQQALDLGKTALGFDPHGYRSQWITLLGRMTDLEASQAR